MSAPFANTELSALLGLFYRRPEDFGQFEKIKASALPDPYRELLAHPRHMTVAMEQFHNSPVVVQVLATKVVGNAYARRILLARQSDGRVVQFGIMWLNFDRFSPEVRREVESQSTPLGRILIQHNILWEIELSALWRITPGPDLCRLFTVEPGQVTYGRTAVIRRDGTPAVELLEVVRPG
jgi:chorismate-pyruvate lyase